MLAPVCDSDGIWENWGPSSAGLEESTVSSGLAGTLPVTLHLSQATHDTGAVLLGMCPCASVPVKAFGKSGEARSAPIRKAFYARMYFKPDRRAGLAGRTAERVVALSPCPTLRLY